MSDSGSSEVDPLAALKAQSIMTPEQVRQHHQERALAEKAAWIRRGRRPIDWSDVNARKWSDPVGLEMTGHISDLQRSGETEDEDRRRNNPDPCGEQQNGDPDGAPHR